MINTVCWKFSHQNVGSVTKCCNAEIFPKCFWRASQCRVLQKHSFQAVLKLYLGKLCKVQIVLYLSHNEQNDWLRCRIRNTDLTSSVKAPIVFVLSISLKAALADIVVSDAQWSRSQDQTGSLIICIAPMCSLCIHNWCTMSKKLISTDTLQMIFKNSKAKFKKAINCTWKLSHVA